MLPKTVTLVLICFLQKKYERLIWHYKHANTDMISKAIQGFDWDKAFLDKSTEKKASIFTKLFSTL